MWHRINQLRTKLSFLWHSSLNNGTKMTPKCHSVFPLFFGISKFNLNKRIKAKKTTKILMTNPQLFYSGTRKLSEAKKASNWTEDIVI